MADAEKSAFAYLCTSSEFMHRHPLMPDCEGTGTTGGRQLSDVGAENPTLVL